MTTFIEDYLVNPSDAIANARISADCRFSDLECQDDTIYSQLPSPEFRLYEEMLLS